VLIVGKNGSSIVTLCSPRRHPIFLLFPLWPVVLLSVITFSAFSIISTAADLSASDGLLE
jgi:hypothetical protein